MSWYLYLRLDLLEETLDYIYCGTVFYIIYIIFIHGLTYFFVILHSHIFFCKFYFFLIFIYEMNISTYVHMTIADGQKILE